jgi:hypothetical protein
MGYALELTPCNGKIVFRARDGAHGDEVFVYDTSTAAVTLQPTSSPVRSIIASPNKTQER